MRPGLQGADPLTLLLRVDAIPLLDRVRGVLIVGVNGAAAAARAGLLLQPGVLRGRAAELNGVVALDGGGMPV
jgi:hypothetical protein